MVDVHAEFSGPKNKRLKDGEEKFVTHLREGITQVMGDDPKSKESIEQTVHQYKQAKGKLGKDCYRYKFVTIIKDGLPKDREQLELSIAIIVADFKLNDIEVDTDEVRVGDSIMIRCRCKTTDGLLGLDKLVASGEWDELFSLVMSGLINHTVTASVSMSEEEFKRCLVSLTADAG